MTSRRLVVTAQDCPVPKGAGLFLRLGDGRGVAPVRLTATSRLPVGRYKGQQRARSGHSTMLSARSRKGSGTVRLIALAVFRLMESSNFVGCSTGRSPGFAPARMR